MTFSTPLPSAFTRFRTAFSALTPGTRPALRQVLDRLHGEVRVHRGGAVADEQRDVVDLADVAGLDEQPDLRPLLRPHQVLVHGRGQQQRRDRREVGVAVAVGQHHEPGAGGDARGHLGADLLQARRQRRRAAVEAVQADELARGEPGLVPVRVDLQQLGELVVVDHGERQHHLAAVRR